MKNIRLIALAALMMFGATMQAQVAGEFYSFVGWEDNNGGSGIRCLAHYTEHGKKVELPYSYLIDDPEAMGIGNDFAPSLKGLNVFKCKFSKDVVDVAPDRDVPLRPVMYGTLVKARQLLKHGSEPTEKDEKKDE